MFSKPKKCLMDRLKKIKNLFERDNRCIVFARKLHFHFLVSRFGGIFLCMDNFEKSHLCCSGKLSSNDGLSTLLQVYVLTKSNICCFTGQFGCRNLEWLKQLLLAVCRVLTCCWTQLLFNVNFCQLGSFNEHQMARYFC